MVQEQFIENGTGNCGRTSRTWLNVFIAGWEKQAN